eukprot:TRINITY_DN62921_c0_g1_i1.p1 TRINITY_DN62921_c0_g1~~TRINITY_DN62921_c0_g1_i1.p1  ORF type:complete len:1597 (+),score=307.41 TRINITY_DN62921_c0_g1_i1:34-4824(+)
MVMFGPPRQLLLGVGLVVVHAAVQDDAWSQRLPSGPRVPELLEGHARRVQAREVLLRRPSLVQKRVMTPASPVTVRRLRSSSAILADPGLAQLPSSKSLPRRLQFGQHEPCENTQSCGENEYCMSCTKCSEYHSSLPKEDQSRWTCEPCKDGSTHCESGKYCEVAKDPVEGTCPTQYPGCGKHSDCEDDEYCFSCAKCEEYMKLGGGNGSLWQCQPCPSQLGGFCSLLAWCRHRQDSITGQCPEERGCSHHKDCQEGQYCESCEYCEAFRNSLPEDKRFQWSCDPCPTAGGGVCEDARLCQVANDGVDRTCPPVKGCDAHVQCKPDEYCMSCSKCAAYRDSLDPEHRHTWPCNWCPSSRGGQCEKRVFCSVAQDSIGDTCPLYEGCESHSDCADSEFCWSYAACKAEETRLGSCGAKPVKSGFCNPSATCTSGRSIDHLCQGARPCSSHEECGRNGTFFCTSWRACQMRTPGACGARPIHRDGVCVAAEHCARGFHTPIDGTCPAWDRLRGTGGARLEIAEVLKYNGSLMLATFHQAFNAWRSLPPDTGTDDYVLAQLHDYANGSSNLHFDDKEYFGVYSLKDGQLSEERQVPTSCPLVEVTIPPHSSKIYEARIFKSELEMSTTELSECSCVVGEYPGRCPRGASFAGSNAADSQSCMEHDDISAIASAPLALLQPGRLQALQECQGAVEVTRFPTIELRQTGSSVRYLRLDTFATEEVQVKGNATLRTDGQYLICDAPVDSDCDTLPRGIKIPVVLVSVMAVEGAGRNELAGLSSKYCNACKEALTRFYPVKFLNSRRAQLANALSLYTLDRPIRAAAKLVDSSLGNGEGSKHMGCPWAKDGEPSLQMLRDAGKVMNNSVEGKWCVVGVGECSITAKVKFCIVSGAAGVLVMEVGASPSRLVNVAAEVYLANGEQLEDMVPVLYSSYDESLWQKLSNGEEVELTAGPEIGVRPASGHASSTGGLRIYDTATSTWTDGGGGFGSQRWMEHSSVRDVLFVCTKEQRILALDTSRSSDVKVALLGKAPSSILCDSSKTFRDVHVVDFRQGENFFTAFLDTGNSRNHIVFFETTDLADWHWLSEVHAHWEHLTQGLGQAKVTEDGKKMLITWHCSTLYCGSTPRHDGSLPGERLYVLSLTDGLKEGFAPPVLGVVPLPMSPGSIVRDVACDKENLCLVSMTWDGIAVVDLSDGPNRLKVIAQHSASFTGWRTSEVEEAELPEQVSFARMVAGSQKVVPSRNKPGRFFMERWSFDAAGWYYEGKPMASSLRYDSIWRVDVEGYVSPGSLGMPPTFDPAVSAILWLPGMSWADAVKSTPGEEMGLEGLLTRGLKAALGIGNDRLIVTGSGSMKDAKVTETSFGSEEGGFVIFSILDGKGASPETLFNALWRQLKTPGSAIYTGEMAGFLSGASLERRGPPPPSQIGRPRDGRQDRDRDRRDRGGRDGSTVPMLLFLATLMLLFFVGVFACCYFDRLRKALKMAQQENCRLVLEQQQLAEVAGSPNGQVAVATGYVIGRPGLASDGSPEKATQGGSTQYVVGNPVASRDEASTNPSSKLDQPERPTPTWPAEMSQQQEEEAHDTSGPARASVVRAPTPSSP